MASIIELIKASNMVGLETMARKFYRSERMQKAWLRQTLQLIADGRHALLTGGFGPKGGVWAQYRKK
jgi:hypothetical protein